MYREICFDVYANDGEHDTTVFIKVDIGNHTLTATERKRQANRFKRALVTALSTVEFTDFGVENIRFTNKRRR